MDFEIGKITKAQGIRGEVRVFPTTDDPSRFELLVGEEVTISGGKKKIMSARLQKNVVILKLEGVNDRNAAEALAGAAISIPAEKALPLEDGEYYIRDLIGLQAIDESGEKLGLLTEVLHTGANDVYVITPSGGDSYMVPAIKNVVLGVCLHEKTITLRLLEGLKELKI
jgi:16S rRNA processing protein RimM